MYHSTRGFRVLAWVALATLLGARCDGDGDGEFARFAYVASGYGDSVSAYAVDDLNSSLRYLGTMGAGDLPSAVVVGRSARFVYVANAAGDHVSQYRIEADGTLSPLVPARAHVGGDSFAVTLEPSGKFVYVTNSVGVSQHRIGANGTLTPLAPAQVEAGETPAGVATVGGFE